MLSLILPHLGGFPVLSVWFCLSTSKSTNIVDIILLNRQFCCLLAKGVCLLGESSLIPLSLFLEQAPGSEDRLLGDRNSRQEILWGAVGQELRSQDLPGPASPARELPVASLDPKP